MSVRLAPTVNVVPPLPRVMALDPLNIRAAFKLTAPNVSAPEAAFHVCDAPTEMVELKVWRSASLLVMPPLLTVRVFPLAKVNPLVPAALEKVTPAVVRFPPNVIESCPLAEAPLKTNESLLPGTEFESQFVPVPHAPVLAPPSHVRVAAHKLSEIPQNKKSTAPSTIRCDPKNSRT
ncbi:MAG: hypothetical protein HZA31_13280 [Opitutae bacterium]|nr:hypothetical protein [Opitutae bacterium]